MEAEVLGGSGRVEGRKDWKYGDGRWERGDGKREMSDRDIRARCNEHISQPVVVHKMSIERKDVGATMKN